MNNKAIRLLTFFVLIVVGLTFFFWGLVQSRSFLLPLTVATLLAMIILPVGRWLEKKGMGRGWASFLSVLTVIAFFAGLAFILAAQVESVVSEWPQIKEQVEPKIEQLQDYIEKKTGFSEEEQEREIANLPGSSIASDGNQSSSNSDSTQTSSSDSTQQSTTSELPPGEQVSESEGKSSSGGGSMLSSVGNVLSHFFSTFGTLLLIFIYTFFFLLYRRMLKNSILQMAPEDKREDTKEILENAARVSQNYLSGRMLLILFLAILYSVGLSISGVQNAILISLLAALLSLIPYVGNVVGYAIAVVMAFVSGSGFSGVIGVSITFTIAQFVESYILEPFVVGSKVDLNPVVTIIVVVLGEAVWGIVGMLVAIPVLAIMKVVFDNVSVLKPLGYLLGDEGDEDKDDESDSFFTRTKEWAMNKFK